MIEGGMELRELEEKYARELLDLFSNDNVVKYTNSSRIDNCVELEKKIKNILSYDGYNYVIIYNNEIIGIIGCILEDIDDLGYDLYYMLKENYWGKGLGKLAVKKIINIIKKDSRVNYLFTDIISLNRASIRIVESLGFSRYETKKKRLCKHGIDEEILSYRLIIGVKDAYEKNN